ncbi:MAG: TonB-dependent receptor [Acidobacteriota bacterium]
MSFVSLIAFLLSAHALSAPVESGGGEAQLPGHIDGRLAHSGEAALEGVTVTISGVVRQQGTTDGAGRFRFDDLPPGSYSLTFRLGDESSQTELEVRAAETTVIHHFAEWRHHFGETLTVRSATRRPERIIDAPVAVNTVLPSQIELGSSLGQLPRLFESAVGVETTQSGLFDFKINVRGINSALNRRLAVTIDGRDPSFPLLDAQEWAGASFPVDDLESAEILRGPSSALYGVNAFNGFLNLVTKAPSTSLGKTFRVAAGDLETVRIDARLAVPLSEGWFLKGLTSFMESDDYFTSRNESVDYSRPCGPMETVDCLTLEASPIVLDRHRVSYYGLRADRVREQSSLVVEGGLGEFEGPVFTGPAGRVQLTDGARPWARVNYNRSQWNVLLTYTGRDVEALTLAPGTPSYADSDRLAIDLQTHRTFAGGKGYLVVGASAGREEVSTADPEGFETLLFDAQDEETGALYGQFDYEVSERVKLVAAGRWDVSSRHDGQFSPQVGVVASATPNSTFRLSYREAFLSPSYPEFSVRVPVAPPLDLSSVEPLCQSAGVDCGFDSPLPLLLVGNPDLKVETIETIELGYRLFAGSRFNLDLDFYRSEVGNFVQVAVPQLGTALGRLNPNFGPYTPPAELGPAAREQLLAALALRLGGLYPFLSNEGPTSPALILVTNSNFGEATTQGLEFSVGFAFSREWQLNFNYSWIDFESEEAPPGLAPLVANSPEHKGNLSLRYTGPKLAASLHYRWTDEFRWIDGIYQGSVPSYGVVNLSANYQVSNLWRAGVDIANLLDSRHYEFFGGDLLGRQAIAHVSLTW